MKYTAEQQKANRDKWVAALRSGDFTQTSGVLRSGDTKDTAQYCCLGVACELAARERVVSPYRPSSADPVYGRYGQGGEDEELPDPVQEWLGLATRTGELVSPIDGAVHLITLNDSGEADFPAIAEVIASGQVKLAEAAS